MADRAENGRERRAAILEILRAEEIHNQLELLRRLRRRGFRVTQPSVSRDLQEIGVAKLEGRYLPSDALAGDRAARVDARLSELAAFVSKVAAAGPYLVVVRTAPGTASPVGLAIDDADWPEVVGTVAGDDTLFIATAGRRHQVRLCARLNVLVREASHA